MIEQTKAEGKGAPSAPNAAALNRPLCPACGLRSGEVATSGMRCLMPLCAHAWPGTQEERRQALSAESAYAMSVRFSGAPFSSFRWAMTRAHFYIFALTSIHCAHSGPVELRAKRRVDGVLMRGWQCQTCGGAATGPRMGKGSHPAPTLPPWDTGLWARHRAEIVPQYEAWIKRMRAERSALWWSLYNAYLDSPAWAALRQQVIVRDGGRCRVCGGPGEHVHHLTYQRVTEESLDDLALLCAPCHAEQHNPEAPSDA